MLYDLNLKKIVTFCFLILFAQSIFAVKYGKILKDAYKEYGYSETEITQILEDINQRVFKIGRLSVADLYSIICTSLPYVFEKDGKNPLMQYVNKCWHVKDKKDLTRNVITAQKAIIFIEETIPLFLTKKDSFSSEKYSGHYWSFQDKIKAKNRLYYELIHENLEIPAEYFSDEEQDLDE